jgi:hypothetical protein
VIEILGEKCTYFPLLKNGKGIINEGDFFLMGDTYYRVQGVVEDGVWTEVRRYGQCSLFFRFPER